MFLSRRQRQLVPATDAPETILVLGHHDLDGVVAAAITGAYLESRHPGADLRYGTVDFPDKPEWSNFWRSLRRGDPYWRHLADELPDGLAVVDFPATQVPRDQFLFFADHHPYGLTPPDVAPSVVRQHEARAADGEPVFFDPEAGSCATMLDRELRRFDGWETPAHLREAAELAHTVDTADYQTVDEALDFRPDQPPALDLLVRAATERAMAEAIEAMVGGRPVDEAIPGALPADIDELLAQVRADARRVAHHIEPVSPQAALLDLTHTNGDARHLQRLRFSEYQYADPQYVIRLVERSRDGGDGQVVVQGLLGRSPWADPLPRDTAHPDLARIAEVYGGGGGHSYAAGFVVQADTLEQARERAREVSEMMLPHLRPLEPSHPFAESPAETPDPMPPARFPSV